MTIKLKDFKRVLQAKANEALQEATKPAILEQVKDSIVNDIKKRVTLGYGVDKNGGNKKKFDPLSDSYVKQRQGKAIFFNKDGSTRKIDILTDSEVKSFRGSKAAREQNRKNRKYAKANKGLGKNAKPKKSNLHKSGQMIEEDLGGKVSSRKDGKNIRIEMKTNRSKKIAEHVSDDRPFMNLSKGEISRVVKFFRSYISEIFRKKIKNI